MAFFFTIAKIKVKQPEEEITLHCSICEKQTDQVYLCRERGLIICPKCQDKFKMETCQHTHGEHQHILFPGIKNRNECFLEEVQRIQDDRHSLRAN